MRSGPLTKRQRLEREKPRTCVPQITITLPANHRQILIRALLKEQASYEHMIEAILNRPFINHGAPIAREMVAGLQGDISRVLDLMGKVRDAEEHE